MNQRERRALSGMGPGYVPCIVNGRYLAFRLDSSVMEDGREFITLAVMTETEKGRKRLCELIIKRQDIERALSCVSPRGTDKE